MAFEFSVVGKGKMASGENDNIEGGKSHRSLKVKLRCVESSFGAMGSL